MPTTLLWLGLESASQPWSTLNNVPALNFCMLMGKRSINDFDHLNLDHLILHATQSGREDGGQITSLILPCVEEGNAVWKRQWRPLLVPAFRKGICVHHRLDITIIVPAIRCRQLVCRLPSVDACPAVAAGNDWCHSGIIEDPRRFCPSFAVIQDRLAGMWCWPFQREWGWLPLHSVNGGAVSAVPFPIWICSLFMPCLAAPAAKIVVVVIVTDYERATPALPPTADLCKTLAKDDDCSIDMEVWGALALSVTTATPDVALVVALETILDVVALEAAPAHFMPQCCMWAFSHSVTLFCCISKVSFHSQLMHIHAS